MAIFEAFHFINHFLRARSLSGHGVHSPFVYELLTTVFPDERDQRFRAIEMLRKSLESDQSTIEVTDFGAGSQVHSSNTRSISAIARHSANSDKIGRLLYRLAKHLNPTGILELGTSLGITTAYLAESGNPVVTIEGCPQTAHLARQNLNRLKQNNVQLFVGKFSDELDNALLTLKDCRMAFVDGHHTYDATIEYYEYLVTRLTPPALIIFDDIYWSSGMKKAWLEIVEDPRNQVTIDLFELGLVFLKPDQAKEHFTVKL